VGASVENSARDRLTVSVMASTRQMILHADDLPAERTTTTVTSVERTSDDGTPRPSRHLVPPPPELTPELADQLFAQGHGNGRRARRKPQQVPLPFEIVTKGRFEKCEPTIRHGHNLDQPTYLRRGVPLN
jgi:hypothetical protein